MARADFIRRRVHPFATGPAPWSVAIDDVNKDGNLDLITVPYDKEIRDRSQVGVTVLLGDGKGGFTAKPGSPFPLTGCRGPSEVATGDINGDGFRDIIVTCSDSSNIAVFLGARDVSYKSQLYPAKGEPRGLAVADLNGDGKDDIVMADSSGDTITILFAK